MITEIVNQISQWKQSKAYQEYLNKLQKQREYILFNFPTISGNEDIENIRMAINSIKACLTCKDRDNCPKATYKNTYIGELDWWNDKVVIRWIGDCRNAKHPIPTVKTYRQQLEAAQEAIAMARAKVRSQYDNC